jgi:CHASE2 domain-containing sensor protein
VGRQVATVLYLLAMVAIVVGADVLWLRHHFTLRLIVNIAIVGVFIAGYFAFLRRP